MEFALQDLLFQLNDSEQEIKKAEEKIKNLKNEIKNNQKISLLKQDNNFLKTAHKLFQEDIIKYKEEILKLEQQIQLNEYKILKVQKENNSIKKSKLQIQKNINHINNLEDLRKTLNLQFFQGDDSPDINIKNNNISNNNNLRINIQNFEELQKKKTEYELKFIKLKEKCNEFHHDIEIIKNIVENYKNFIKEINQQMNVFNEIFNISVSNESNNVINNNTYRNKLDEINGQSDVASVCIIQLDEMFFNTQNNIGDNIEHLLNKIYINLIKIDKHEYKDENSLKDILGKIGKGIDDIQNIIFIFEDNKNNFYKTQC
jgi:chromosome segregation ATPase